LILSHVALALLVVIIWGLNFVVVKVGVVVIPPLLFCALRFSFAAIPLVFFVERPAIPLPTLVAYGVIQFACQFAFLYSGLKVGLGAGLASLVIQLQVFITILLAVLLLHERPRPLQIMGALLSLAGIAVVGATSDSRSSFGGFLLVVLGACSWASANLITKRMGPVRPLALVAWGSLIAAPVLFGLSAAIEGPQAIAVAFDQMNWRDWLSVEYQAYPNTIFAFAVWSMLVRRYPSAVVTPYGLLIPVVGMAAGALVLDEALTSVRLLAALLILLGLVLNQLPARGAQR
jgi:O-acetylserine/cysteine efflux transporter